MYVVGGSAAAGAGGAGVNHTFDAQLASRLNELLERAEVTSRRPLGRVMRTSVAQGGTTSFWAALMADALHGRSAHILVWEYAINDHSVSLEAAGRGASAAASLGPPTMRYMIDAWLRRSLSYRPPPLLMLTYLWDKQPAAPFKAGNRALCRHMPVPSSAYDAQRSVLEQYGRAGAGVATKNDGRSRPRRIWRLWKHSPCRVTRPQVTTLTSMVYPRGAPASTCSSFGTIWERRRITCGRLQS
jgi:hypothetical protein